MKIFNFCLASVAVLFLAVSCGKEEYGMSGRKEVVGNDGYGLSAMTMDYDEVKSGPVGQPGDAWKYRIQTTDS